MDEFAPQTARAETLESQSDNDLRAVIDQARRILEARESKRKKQAVAEIRRIAKEHGLDVAIDKPARKRGRPRKEAPGFR